MIRNRKLIQFLPLMIYVGISLCHSFSALF